MDRGNREISKVGTYSREIWYHTVKVTRFDDMFLKALRQRALWNQLEINLVTGDARTSVEVVSVDRGERLR